jgi:hypothetical protein
MKKATQQSQGNTGDIFAWGGKACEKMLIAAKPPCAREKPWADWEK